MTVFHTYFYIVVDTQGGCHTLKQDNMYLNIAPSTLGNQSYVWELWILVVISGHLTVSRTPCQLPCTQIQNVSLTCSMTPLKPCWKLSCIFMYFYIMKEVSDVLQFVILKSGPKVCSFISVRERVFDLYFMSAVVVETIVSNFLVCEILPKNSLMLWSPLLNVCTTLKVCHPRSVESKYNV